MPTKFSGIIIRIISFINKIKDEKYTLEIAIIFKLFSTENDNKGNNR